MFLSSEIRVRSKLFARSYVIYRLGIFALVTLIVFVIPYLGERFSMLFQPDWDVILIKGNMGEAYRYFGLSLCISLALFVLNMPLLLGMFAWMSELSMGRRQKISYLFCWCTPFSRLLKAMRAGLVFLLKAMIEALKFSAIPIAGMLYLGAYGDKIEVNAYAILLMMLMIFLIVGLVYTAVRVCAYYPALYLLSVVPELSVSEAFSQSRDFLYVNRSEFYKLILGFIPWYLVETLTFGIAGLFIKPYFYFTMLLFVQQIYNKWLFETGKTPEYVDPLTNLFEEKEEDV